MIQVMIIEDEPPIGRGLKSMIESTHDSFEVVAMAYNGQEALDLLKKIQPDMIITDIRMPIMDGIELAREVRKRFPDIQIILLSGYQEFDYAREAMQLGIMHYLLKPLSKMQLKTMLDDLYTEMVQRKRNRYKQAAASLIKGERRADDPFEEEGLYAAHMLMLCCAGSMPIFTYNDDIPGKAFWERYDLQKTAEGEAAGGFGDLTVFNGNSVSERWICLSLYKNQAELRSPDEWAKTVADWLGGDLPISIAYSPYYSDIRQTAIFSQSMRSTLYRNMIFGVSTRISIQDDAVRSEFPLNSNPFLERKLSLTVGPQYVELFKTEVMKIVDSWRQAPPRQIYVKHSLTRILEGLLQTLHIDHLCMSAVPDYVQYIIAHASDYESLSQNVCSTIDTFFSMRIADLDDEETNVDIV